MMFSYIKRTIYARNKQTSDLSFNINTRFIREGMPSKNDIFRAATQVRRFVTFNSDTYIFASWILLSWLFDWAMYYLPWPNLWVKYFPKPASSSTCRATRSTSAVSVPLRAWSKAEVWALRTRFQRANCRRDSSEDSSTKVWEER